MAISDIPASVLEVRDLRLILALTQAGTTQGAAKLLHLAQPSVSRALLSCEQRVASQLFDRTPRGLVPTRAGALLAQRAADLLNDLCALERRVCEPTEPVRRISLVCECHTAYHWLPSALRALRKTAPGVELDLRLDLTRDPISALVAGEVDAALVTSPCTRSRVLDVQPLFEDEMLFVVSTDHALAKRKALRPTDLQRHTLFTGPPTPQEARWFMSSVFGRARPRLDIATVPLTEAVIDLARAGMGIGIVTSWVAGPHLQRGGLVTKRLTSGPLERPWQLAFRRELGALGATLRQTLIEEHFGSFGGTARAR